MGVKNQGVKTLAFLLRYCCFMYILCIYVEGGKNMIITAKRWGNSTAIRLPKTLLDELNIVSDEPEFEIKVKGDELILKKTKEPSNLEELFAAFDDEEYFKNNSNNFDWGEPQGKEIW